MPKSADPVRWGAPAGAVELVGKRTPHAKHFRNPTGNYTGVFGRGLHYEAAPGVFEETNLTFRQIGQGYVADKYILEARVDSAGFSVTDKSQKGLRWILPAPSAVAGNKATFQQDGLDWDLFFTKAGIKSAAIVAAPRGPHTHAFRYALIGGAAPFVTDDGGRLVSDAFTVQRPFIIGANTHHYACSPWRLLPGNVVAFDVDDTFLPPEAFPYVIDPSSTFNVAASGEDGYAGRYEDPLGGWPPDLTDLSSAGASDVMTKKSREISGKDTYYYLIVGLVRWDTSSLADTVTVTAATLRIYVMSTLNTDSRNFLAEWYNHGGVIDSGDWTSTESSNAHSGTSIASITASADNDFSLTNLTNISKTSYTGLRLHISGSAPSASGINSVQAASFDHATLTEPRLLVTYNTPPNAPSWVAPAASATLVGSASLQASATDPDSDNIYVSFRIYSDSGYSVLVRTVTGSTVTSGSTSTGTWDTTLDPNGTYYLQAQAFDTGALGSGNTNLGSVTVANTKGYQMML